MEWFKQLKKWQQGGLIGCVFGIILAILIISDPGQYSPGGWIIQMHLFLVSFSYVLAMITAGETSSSAHLILYGGAGIIMIIFYGGLGALFGKIQQMANTYWKWSLTALLTLLIFGFYIAHLVPEYL